MPDQNAIKVSRNATDDLPRCLLSGIDSLYVSFYLDTANSLIDWEQLEYEKTTLRSERDREIAEYELGSETFALMRYGKAPYRYILTSRDFKIMLSETNSPSCHVQFFSEGLWLRGLGGLTDRLHQWFKSLDLRQTRQPSVGRVDWSYDFDLPVADFNPDNILTRAHKDASWRNHKAYQTLQVGGGDTLIRMYDKIAEITEASGKVFFFELWGQKENVWRIEAQVRKNRLKKAGINTIDDIRDLGGDLLHDLYNRHTTLRVPTEDSNQARWPIHPVWLALQQEVATLPRTGLLEAYSPINSFEYRRYCLGKSLTGYAKRMAFLEFMQSDGTQIPDHEWAIESLGDLIREHVRPETWQADVEKLLTKERFGL